MTQLTPIAQYPSIPPTVSTGGTISATIAVAAGATAAIPIARQRTRSVMVEPGFWRGLKDSVTHYILPVFAVSLIGLAGHVRFQRAAMIEVLGQDDIRTARAKGVLEPTVILKHAWRNALIPIVTLLGYVLVILVEGSIVVETNFTWPGMGLLAADALTSMDYPVVMGVVILSSAMIVLGTLLYAVVDPASATAQAGSRLSESCERQNDAA